MKESVKNFIEKNILALEEDLVLFLDVASAKLSRQDVNILCAYLDTAGIEYKEHVPTVIDKLVKDNISLQLSSKVPLSSVVANLPRFNYIGYVEFSKVVVNAIKKAYPNKTFLTDSYGIEYVMEQR